MMASPVRMLALTVSLALAACGSGSGGGGGNTTTPFAAGVHFHDTYTKPLSLSNLEPTYRYSVWRVWAPESTPLWDIWKSDGSIDYSSLEAGLQRNALKGAKAIYVFSGVPTWASKRPGEADVQWFKPGRKAGPANLDAYEDMAFRLISRIRPYLWAVEGENEPWNGDCREPWSPTYCSGDSDAYSTMTLTELADLQKRLYRAAKRVDSNLMVFSPALSALSKIPDFLTARTSQGEPITQFFDVLAYHPYNHSSDNARQIAGTGVGPIGASLNSLLDSLQRWKAAAGIAGMRTAASEMGWGPWHPSGAEFAALSDAQKGNILYETAKVLKNRGDLMVGWYAHYDRENLIGNPMNSSVIGNWLDLMYRDMATFGPAQ